MNEGDSLALFSAISSKLGTPVRSIQGGTTVLANTFGAFLVSEFKTMYSDNASGLEVIMWRKSNVAYHLFSYSINSKELLTR